MLHLSDLWPEVTTSHPCQSTEVKCICLSPPCLVYIGLTRFAVVGRKGITLITTNANASPLGIIKSSILDWPFYIYIFLPTIHSLSPSASSTIPMCSPKIVWSLIRSHFTRWRNSELFRTLGCIDAPAVIR